MRKTTHIVAVVVLFTSFTTTFISRAFAQYSMEVIPDAQQLVLASGFSGTVLVLDQVGNTLYTSNAAFVDQRFIPASTFKVFSTLVALQSGVVTNREAIIAWDGIERGRPEINRDLDLQTAFQLSAVPHFQYMVRTIGAERMQHFLNAVNYGNRNMSGGIDQFWLTGELRISPREQIEFLAKLYAGDLPFRPEVMQEVREIMRSESAADFTIFSKTGWATLGESDHTGWWIGWVEKSDKPFFFATVLQTTVPGEMFGPARLEITRQVLKQLRVL